MAVDSLPYGSVNDKVGLLYFTFLIHSYQEYVAVDSLPYGSVNDKVGISILSFPNTLLHSGCGS